MNHSEAENHMLSVPALDMYYGGHMDSNASQAAMAATERRLYALPIIRERIEDLSKNDPEKAEIIKDITANINIRYE